MAPGSIVGSSCVGAGNGRSHAGSSCMRRMWIQFVSIIFVTIIKVNSNHIEHPHTLFVGTHG